MWPYKAQAIDLEAITQTCALYGFCLVKNFFNSEEIHKIRLGLVETNQHFGAITPDPLSCPALNWLVADPRVLEIARALLKQELVYYANGSINFENEIGPLTNAPYTALHSDAAGRPDALSGYPERDGKTPFPAYRFAIYMQDYAANSGCVRVVPGSHLWIDRFDMSDSDAFSAAVAAQASTHPSRAEHFIEMVPTQPGDLVIWNLGLIHGAGAKRLRNTPDCCLHPSEEEALLQENPAQFLPPPGPRNAIFFDYGAVSEAVDLYIKFYTQTQTSKRLKPFSRGQTDAENIYNLISSTGARLREDGLIISLCFQIEHAKRSGDSVTVRSLFERLYRLVERHREFSAHHHLFDRSRFDTLKSSSWKKAVGYSQQMIMLRISHNQTKL